MPPRQALVQQTNSDTDYVFYIHPSEGISSLTISSKLNGSNYLAWSLYMQHTLGAKNKLAQTIVFHWWYDSYTWSSSS